MQTNKNQGCCLALFVIVIVLVLIGNQQWGILLAGGAVVAGVAYYRNTDGYKMGKQREAVEAAYRQAQFSPDHQREGLFEAVLNADPKHVGALINLATIKSRQGAYSEVEALCRRILQVEPESVGGRWLLAEAFLNHQLPDDAIPLYEGLLATPGLELPKQMAMADGAATGYRMTGDPAAALRVLESVDVEEAPHDETLRSWMVRRAAVKYSAGDETGALADLAWVEQAWPGAGVATMRNRMTTGQLRGVLGSSPATPKAHATHCPVCGAPRKAPGVLICRFCSTAF